MIVSTFGMGGKADDSCREIISFRREDGEKGEGLRAESFHGRGGELTVWSMETKKKA